MASHETVFDICGNLVELVLEWWREWSVAELSSVMVALSLVADDAMVFNLLVDEDEFLDEEDEDGVFHWVLEDEGESEFLSKGGFGNRLLNQLCLSAIFGVILWAGSHSRHLRIKSKKRGSLQPFNAACKLLVPGGPRGFPLLLWPPCSIVEPSAKVLVTQYRG